MKKILIVGALTLTLVGALAMTPAVVKSDQGTAEAVSCWQRSRGTGIKNGFGQTVAAFAGHMSWCGNGRVITSGRFWVTVYRCCNWYYEGIVAKRNYPGCFSGSCHMVERYRMGKFELVSPYGAITGRYQPWVTLRGWANGKFESAAGGS